MYAPFCLSLLLLSLAPATSDDRYEGDGVVLILTRESEHRFYGSVYLGEDACPLEGRFERGHLKGTFTAEGHAFSFEAEFEGDRLYFETDGTRYVLDRVSTRPNPCPPLVLEHRKEPKEGAFTLLVPQGWKLGGGIFRVDPIRGGGPRQSIEAKLDLVLGIDTEGTIGLRFLPDWYYCDIRHMPVAQTGFFPRGSNYQGMTVCEVPSAVELVRTILFPKAHPNATKVKIVETRPLPDLVREHRSRASSLILPLQIECDAVTLRIEYEEEGHAYEERFFALVEDKGAIAGGEWANRASYFFRAPKGELARWEPVFYAILNSIRIDPTWWSGELQGILTRLGIYHDVAARIRGNRS